MSYNDKLLARKARRSNTLKQYRLGDPVEDMPDSSEYSPAADDGPKGWLRNYINKRDKYTDPEKAYWTDNLDSVKTYERGNKPASGAEYDPYNHEVYIDDVLNPNTSSVEYTHSLNPKYYKSPRRNSTRQFDTIKDIVNRISPEDRYNRSPKYKDKKEYLKYLTSPDEIWSRSMQLKHEMNLDPNVDVTIDDVNTFRSINRSFDKYKFNEIFNFMDDDEIREILNTTDAKPVNERLLHQRAKNGGKIKQYRRGGSIEKDKTDVKVTNKGNVLHPYDVYAGEQKQKKIDNAIKRERLGYPWGRNSDGSSRSFSQRVKQDFPSHLKKTFDAGAWMNPLFGTFWYGSNALNDIYKGNYTDATLNALNSVTAGRASGVPLSNPITPTSSYYYHAGLPRTFNIKRDFNANNSLYMNRGLDYEGVGANEYARQNGYMHRFKIPNNAKVKNIPGDKGSISGVKNNDIIKYSDDGYDLLKGESWLGSDEFILLNPDVVKKTKVIPYR